MNKKDIGTHARAMRKAVLKMAYDSGSSAHLGGALSAIDIMAVLYSSVMRLGQDKFILSKGHGVLALYATLAEFGIMPRELLATYGQDGTALVAHPVMNERLGIESSSGSLGQGVSMAVGLALAAKRSARNYHTYTLLGNGECNEGSVWEAAMSAVQFGLSNLTIIVDNNHMQSDGFSHEIMSVSDNYAAMFSAIGLDTVEVDGHDIEAIYEALTREQSAPRAIVAHTVKGKGVSFMENNNEWHHNRLTETNYQAALSELEANG